LARSKIEQLSTELERGESQTLKAYLAAMAKLPRYSLHNLLLIMAQRPGVQQSYAGLRVWNRLGRSVRPGEHGVAILAPVMRRRRRRDSRPIEPRARDESESPVDDEIVTNFRRVLVFGEDQTTGAPLPHPACANGDPGIYFGRLVQAIADRSIRFMYSPAITPAHGASTPDQIIIRPDLDPAERFATAAHELGHILLGHHRPNDPAATPTLRETEAEAVAYVVCQSIGLDTNSSSSDYVLGWGGDAKSLAASLERVQRTASEIIAAIGPDL